MWKNLGFKDLWLVKRRRLKSQQSTKQIGHSRMDTEVHKRVWEGRVGKNTKDKWSLLWTSCLRAPLSLQRAKYEINNPFRNTGPTLLSWPAFSGRAGKGHHPLQPLDSQAYSPIRGSSVPDQLTDLPFLSPQLSWQSASSGRASHTRVKSERTSKADHRYTEVLWLQILHTPWLLSGSLNEGENRNKKK